MGHRPRGERRECRRALPRGRHAGPPPPGRAGAERDGRRREFHRRRGTRPRGRHGLRQRVRRRHHRGANGRRPAADGPTGRASAGRVRGGRGDRATGPTEVPARQHGAVGPRRDHAAVGRGDGDARRRGVRAGRGRPGACDRRPEPRRRGRPPPVARPPGVPDEPPRPGGGHVRARHGDVLRLPAVFAPVRAGGRPRGEDRGVRRQGGRPAVGRAGSPRPVQGRRRGPPGGDGGVPRGRD